ncbi:MAG: glycosyltransferase family 9 protein, partial [Patescibacteria group bacterium]
IYPILRALVRPHRRVDAPPRRILVTELWHIGDVVIALPFIAALRERFPGASITLLTKAHAHQVLAGCPLVDEVISHDFPWSYEDVEARARVWRIRELRAAVAVIRRLRRERFDLGFDCSRDGRNHLLLFLGGSARRVGFDFGGGARVLTDPVAAGSLDRHRSDDWFRLLEPFGEATSKPVVRLPVSPGEREWALEFLREQGIGSGDIVVAVHPGGSSHLKRWSLESFLALAEIAALEFHARVLWIVDPAGTGANADLPSGAVRVRPTLRQLFALLERSSMLACNDGGPMHLAAAVGTPTFAIYSWGKPEWWQPSGPTRHASVLRTDIACRPCSGHCIFAEPICLTGLGIDAVTPRFRSALGVALGEVRA